MIVVKDNEELKSYIENGVIKFNFSILCEFDIDVEADIFALHITAHNIIARNIYANNIDVDVDIFALHITARNITARNIIARDVIAWDIDVNSINCKNVYAWDIETKKIICKNIDANIKYI